jgi:hypothetical protein
MDDTSSEGSAHGKESVADEQAAQAHLWRVTISSRRLFWQSTFARASASFGANRSNSVAKRDLGCPREQKILAISMRGDVAEWLKAAVC